MSNTPLGAFEQMRDIAQEGCGDAWSQIRPVAEPELRAIAKTMEQVSADRKQGKLSRGEANQLLEWRLDQLRQVLLASGVLGVLSVTRLVEAIRDYLFPAEKMMSRPAAPPSFGGPHERSLVFSHGGGLDLEEMASAAPDLSIDATMVSAKPKASETFDASAEPPPGQKEAAPPKELDRAWGEKSAMAEESAGDLVDCSVFAPPAASPGSEIMLQVFAHLPEHADEARMLAKEQDESATRRGFTTLDMNIVRGSTLTFELTLAQATVEDGLQHLRWRGATAYVAFMARIADTASGKLSGKLIVSQNGMPVGRILFQIKVGSGAEAIAKPIGEARRYHKAFISYASKDRTEVLKRVQMLRLNHIEFFQDVLDLDPGERWEQALYKHIDDADLFLLFWSSAARASEWVRKELDYAAQRRHANAEADPDIVPVIIEGPPPAAPPEGYENLHFNDRLIYFMQS